MNATLATPTQTSGPKPLEALPETPPPRIRYHELDALRAFAMLLGIFWHAAVLADALPETRDGLSSAAVGFLVDSAHSFRLPVFFVMAGFFAALVVSRGGAGAFARARLKRIGLPLVVGALLLVPVCNALTAWSSSALWGGAHQPIDLATLTHAEPYHLWFLVYLLAFYALLLGARRLRGAASAARRLTVLAATSRLRLLILVPPLAFVLYEDSLWLHRGVDATFAPTPGGVLFYGSFFAFGYLLYAQRELLPALRADYRTYTLIALVAAVVAVSSGRLVSVIASVTVAWAATFALMGWFQRWFTSPSARVRYMADSSYWLYLAHFPIVVFLYVEATRAGVPMPVKVIGIPALSIAALLVVYDHAVRYTAVGRVLHGPRERPAS